MIRVEITYRIELMTPMHIGTGVGFARMVDDTVVRAGPAKGNGARLPYVPGSSVKGKARSRVEAIARAMDKSICGDVKCKNRPCAICLLFGSPMFQGSLHFSDALLPKEMSAFARAADSTSNEKDHDPFSLSTIRAGNKIERATKTVQPDFLFSIEHAADRLQLEGSISGQIGDEKAGANDASELFAVYLLVVGLLSIDKIGGNRSRGLGRCQVSIARLIIEGEERDPSPAKLKELL